MTTPSQGPYWIDDLKEKQEGYRYGQADARDVIVEHEGRSLRLLIPELVPSTAVRVVAATEDLLFLLGEQLDEQDIEGEITEGGDGVLMVARRLAGSDDTYCLSVWHCLFPETLQYLETGEDVEPRG